MKTIVTTAVLTSFGSKVDKSLSFRGVTPELTSTERVALMDFQGLNVRLLIEPIDFPSDGKMEVKSKLDNKTPSERLRAVLFVWWKQEGEQGVFIDFYRNKMEALIDGVKNNLREEA